MPRWETYKVGLTRKGKPVYGFVPSPGSFTIVFEEENQFYLDIGGFYINDDQLLISGGSATAPGLAFLGTPTTGIYQDSNSRLRIAKAGTLQVDTETNNGFVLIGDTIVDPAGIEMAAGHSLRIRTSSIVADDGIGWTDGTGLRVNTGQGVGQSTDREMLFDINGVAEASLATDRFKVYGGFYAESAHSNTIVTTGDGSAGMPSISFNNAPTAGMWLDTTQSAKEVKFAVEGSNQLTISKQQGIIAEGGFYSVAFGEPVYELARYFPNVIDLVNSTAETDVFNVIIPANTLSNNRCIRAHIFGDYFNNSGANRIHTIRIYLGSTLVYSDASPNTGVSTARRSWTLDLHLANQGATNAQILGGTFVQSSGVAVTIGIGDISLGWNTIGGGPLQGSATEDSTQNLVFRVTMQLAVADVNYDIRKQYAFMERI